MEIATFDPMLPLKRHSAIETSDIPHEYNVTSFKNGLRVLTESSNFPGTVNLGILLDVGTRDETNDNSGSLLALKNTYFKTSKFTNETINYGMIQMSGGAVSMDYDQERTYFRGSCLDFDTRDTLQMMFDIAFEPKSEQAANLARVKN